MRRPIRPTSPMSSPAPLPPARIDARGLAATATAFFIWGLMPLYLAALRHVPVLQVTAHRLVWGCIVGLAWLALRSELKLVRTALSDSKVRLRLCLSALLISINWVAYVWGIANHHAVEASLGYFINPLVNVLLGIVFFGERLNRAQWTSVAIAATGVAYLTWNAGHLPWIALVLAFSFGLYGAVRKVVQVDALAGFASETLLLVPLGIGFLFWCEWNATGVLGHGSVATHALLMAGGPITAIPLVLFAFGARRIPYSTVGLLQYIGPSIQLVIALFVFHEPFTRERGVGFALIWTALAIYAIDGVWRARRLARQQLTGDS